MVVDKVDIVSIAIIETQDHSPVAGNRDTPEPLQSALWRMKAVAGEIEVRRLAGIIKVRWDERNATGQVRTYPARIAVFEHAPETMMAEASNHGVVCRVPVYLSNECSCILGCVTALRARR